LGSKLGIDLFGEEEGTVPTPEWKKRVIGEGWYLGDTYHYGIGQGFLLTTPLQVNILTQAIANNGVIYKPHILAGQIDVKTKKFLSDETISLIREGMIESCSTGGVAWPLFDFKYKKANSKNETEKLKIACKTGTAQHGGEEDLPHAWITLFAPAEKPEIILTVLSESSGEGSNIAAPIAKKILEAYFEKK
jgi:penicillin-binding protein 2